MKLTRFLKDKLYFILTFLGVYLILILMFLAFRIDSSLIIATSILLFFFVSITLLIEYVRKRNFYTHLLSNIEALDKAYLVLETIEKPTFYDGELLYQALYEINKSMNEFTKNLEFQLDDFKEYIEMWIHEVKVPISSLVLMTHNHQEKFDKRIVTELKRIEDYVEQVLYYVRSENAEKDYLIKEVSLSKVISHVALKNKNDLLENKIDFKVQDVNYKVYTDSKWCEFILNQIVNNSIKYRKKEGISCIQITAEEKEDCTILIVKDYGIGIPPGDLPKVFLKSFTGYNGRIMTKSTGMGLFIAKNLCEKLGHRIEIESKQGEYTKVSITFSKHHFYDVVK